MRRRPEAFWTSLIRSWKSNRHVIVGLRVMISLSDRPLLTTLYCLSFVFVVAMFFVNTSSASGDTLAVAQLEGFSAKVLAAALAFFGGAISAGLAISRAGAAGLAATAERPEVRTLALIIAAFGEALAIYGIVIAFFILAQT